MSSYGAAVGAEEVGGVTAASKGMVNSNAEGRVQSSRTLNNVSEGTGGRMVGPAGDLMRGTMNEHANASTIAARHVAQVAQSFAQGEKHVVQGTVDSAQQQKTSIVDAEATFTMLSKPINA
jgi:hypothetical protein